jgi:hypothetical protein
MAVTNTSNKNNKKHNKKEESDEESIHNSGSETDSGSGSESEHEIKPQKKVAKKQTKTTTTKKSSETKKKDVKEEKEVKDVKEVNKNEENEWINENLSEIDDNEINNDNVIMHKNKQNNSHDQDDKEYQEHLNKTTHYAQRTQQTNKPHYNHHQHPPKQNKHDNSAINFNYVPYRTMCTGITNEDLIKTLVVRAYDANQKQLYETQKQILRAMNFECPFPETISPYPKEYDQSKERPPYKPNKIASKNTDTNYRSHATGFTYNGKNNTSKHQNPHFGNREE